MLMKYVDVGVETGDEEGASDHDPSSADFVPTPGQTPRAEDLLNPS